MQQEQKVSSAVAEDKALALPGCAPHVHLLLMQSRAPPTCALPLCRCPRTVSYLAGITDADSIWFSSDVKFRHSGTGELNLAAFRVQDPQSIEHSPPSNGSCRLSGECTSGRECAGGAGTVSHGMSNEVLLIDPEMSVPGQLANSLAMSPTDLPLRPDVICVIN